MHDRRHPGQEPTLAVDDGTDHRLHIEDLVDDYPREDDPRHGLRDDPRDGVVIPLWDEAPRADTPDGQDGRDEFEPVQDRESTLARRAKLVALFVVTALLIASVIIASSVTAEESGSDPGASPPQREHQHRITGAAALGGFALPATHRRRPPASPAAGGHRRSASGLGPATTAPTSAPETTAPDTTEADGPEADGPEPGHTGAGAPETGTKDPTTPKTTEPTATADPRGEQDTAMVDRTAVVRDFYDKVRTAPEDALALLDPALASDSRERLLLSWRSMTSVLVHDVRRLADGTVRAVVTMVPAYGSPLRVTQLLGLSDGPKPLINHATLLSVRAL